jgi:hypothetical protein
MRRRVLYTLDVLMWQAEEAWIFVRVPQVPPTWIAAACEGAGRVCLCQASALIY